MTKLSLFRLKNLMIFGNFISNLIGVYIIKIISNKSIFPPSPETINLVKRIDTIFLPLSFTLAVALILYYELPIRLYLNHNFYRKPLSKEIKLKARQRLLNEPFFIIGLNLVIWLIAAVTYPTIFHVFNTGHMIAGRTFFQTLLTGLITSSAAFFVLERILQKRLVPYFFPEGGLSMMPNIFRIRIQTRFAAFFITINLIPFLAFLAILSGTNRSSLEPDQLLNLLKSTILTNSIIFIGIGLFMTLHLSGNLTRPFEEIIRVLKSIRNGSLDQKVRVTSTDEIGYTGDAINEMTEGLKEREMMRHSLELAREVQQNLLPKSAPRLKGVDIAGKSIYCDQTGGDYFDFLQIEGPTSGKIGLVVGDVSGHGIPSALLMATARAFIRLRTFITGSIAQVVTDVNYQLVKDVEESGQFMTLFYMMIDTARKRFCWVRAGHDPAIFYDPKTTTFDELKGIGIPLGLDENWQYVQNERNSLSKGQIIVIGTDGLWETRNPDGKMFGKHAIYEIIRQHKEESANAILEAIINDLNRFISGHKAEDDVTLVVVKIMDENFNN